MDEIIQIKVSQLPVAESLENLSILGIDLVTNQSVQALMALLKGLDGKNVQLQKTSTHIQWRVEGGSWANLVALTDLKGDTGANIELQKNSTHVQWRVIGGSWANLIPLADLKGAKGDPFTYSDFTTEQINGLKVKGDPGENIELQVTPTHIQWRVVGASTWINLIALSELKVKGDTGANIELQKTATHIQWKVSGESTWTNLIALSDLKGDTGENIELNISATHVQWRVAGSSTWINLIALSELKGAKGDDAKEVEFQKTATHIQWRRVGESWANLVLLSDLKGNKGDDGKEVQLQKTATHLQWRLAGGSWANLVALADLKGDTGAVPIISVGTVQTIAPGGQSSAEFVTDGLDPNGVQKYKLNLVLVQGATGSVGSIETVTVAFTQASTRANINTGETFAVLLGKIKKWFADLGSLAFKNKVSWNTDIDDRPSIPSKVSDLTNDSGYLNENAVKAVKVNNASDADTVNGKTVAVNVPAGAKFTDTVYTHPTTAGNKHIPEGGSEGQILRYSAAGTAAWGAENTGVALGETISTAYRGDRGKTAYDHSQATHAPTNAQKNSDITKAEIEAKLTGAISSHYHEASVFTGNVLPLDNALGSFQTATANNSATFTLGITKIAGAWGKVLVNRSSQPTITGATIILGSEFEANANMYMVYGYDGNKTEYYFAKITE